MIVPSSFFKKFLASHNMKKFVKINKRSINAKRRIAAIPPEQKAITNAKKSASSRRYWDNVSDERRAELYEKRAAATRKGIANESKYKRKKRSTDAIKSWANDPIRRKIASCLIREANILRLRKVDYDALRKIEKKETRRVNDYAGPLTFSELTEL